MIENDRWAEGYGFTVVIRQGKQMQQAQRYGKSRNGQNIFKTRQRQHHSTTFVPNFP